MLYGQGGRPELIKPPAVQAPCQRPPDKPAAPAEPGGQTGS
jgi:hypothetical protein